MRIRNLVSIALAMTAGFWSADAIACNTDVLYGKAYQSMPPGFEVLRGIPLDGARGARTRARITITLQKDRTYSFSVASGDGKAEGLIATLRTIDGQFIATNLQGQRYYPTFGITSRTTGEVIIDIEFRNSRTYCGALIVGEKTA